MKKLIAPSAFLLILSLFTTPALSQIKKWTMERKINTFLYLARGNNHATYKMEKELPMYFAFNYDSSFFLNDSSDIKKLTGKYGNFINALVLSKHRPFPFSYGMIYFLNGQSRLSYTCHVTRKHPIKLKKIKPDNCMLLLKNILPFQLKDTIINNDLILSFEPSRKDSISIDMDTYCKVLAILITDWIRKKEIKTISIYCNTTHVELYYHFRKDDKYFIASCKNYIKNGKF